MEDTMAESPGLLLGDAKATDGMRDSLSNLIELLRCPLCEQVFDKPTTLASCAHSFCVGCIDQYCCNAWVCPVEGCTMPMSIVGGHGGSYRKINPQLSQTVESMKVICQSLNRTPDLWWKSESAIILASADAAADNPPLTENDNDPIIDEGEGNESESDDENLVDLQSQHQNPEPSGDSDNGNDSEWEN